MISAGYSEGTILPGLQWNTGHAYSSNKQKILYGALCFMVKISLDSVNIFSCVLELIQNYFFTKDAACYKHDFYFSL